MDKDFGEEDVVDENIEQYLQVVKEKVNKHVIFQPSKMTCFFLCFDGLENLIPIFPWNLSYYPTKMDQWENDFEEDCSCFYF